MCVVCRSTSDQERHRRETQTESSPQNQVTLIMSNQTLLATSRRTLLLSIIGVYVVVIMLSEFTQRLTKESDNY